MKTRITQLLDEPDQVSDEEIRLVLMNLLEHLKLEAIRYHGEGPSYIAIEETK